MDVKKINGQIKKQIEVLENLLTELDEEKKEQYHFDVEKIEKKAKSAKFKEHFIRDFDSDIAKKYCSILTSFIKMAEGTDKRIKQYYFTFRILFSHVDIQESNQVITDADLVGVNEFEEIKNELRDNIKVLLCDILLMISMDGNVEEKQLEYYCEMLAYFNINNKELEAIYKVCACILAKKREELFQYAQHFPIAKLSCYLEEPITGGVVTSLEGIKKEKEDSVIVVGLNIKNTTIDIDSYGKKKIEFKNCKFENISSLKGKNTYAVFVDCHFENCKQEYELRSGWEMLRISREKKKTEFGLFSFNKGEFIGCVFNKCSHTNNNNATTLLEIKNGKIEKCKFMDCRTESNGTVRETDINSYRNSYGALLKLDNVVVSESEFRKCVVWDNGSKEDGFGTFRSDFQYLNTIYCSGGSVESCTFDSCECNGLCHYGTKKHNYVLNLIGAMDKNNISSKCNVSNSGADEWERLNDYEMMIE